MQRIILTCFLFISPLIGFGQTSLPDTLNMILHEDARSEIDRMQLAVQTIEASDESAENQIALLRSRLLPFTKNVKDKTLRNRIYILYYNALRNCYSLLDDNENYHWMLDSMLIYADAAEASVEKADTYTMHGDRLIKDGHITEGQKYLFQSIEILEGLGGNEGRIANSLYNLAIPYLEMKDVDGLKLMVKRLEELAVKSKSNAVLYRLHSIQQVYYGEEYLEHPDNPALLDSAILYAKKTIANIENHIDELPVTLLPFYDYYNLAVTYLELVKPTPLDSVRYYLDKAEQWKTGERMNDIYMDIALANVRAWAFLYEGNHKAAEAKMLQALDLIHTADNNFVLPDLSDAYKFFVQLYEETHQPVLALKYQKLLTDNEAKRINIEKVQAVKEMDVRYETAQKEMQIVELEQEKQQRELIIIISWVASFVLIGLIVLLIIIYRLRQKRMEQELYEAALVSEQYQQEMEQRAGQKTGKTIFHKMMHILEISSMDNVDKEQYLQKLKKIDLAALEETFTSLGKITTMDMKYLVCFAIDMNIKDIALLFNIAPASVYTVRYRIKKKTDAHFLKSSVFLV
ncbi:MAG: hypothetical protein LBN18_01080 [Dysgonamonadaceae bacterium]|jgi:hypothetical protein|nr:hypothetical protein [Dysgonamonadaceae bacterium]